MRLAAKRKFRLIRSWDEHSPRLDGKRNRTSDGRLLMSPDTGGTVCGKCEEYGITRSLVVGEDLSIEEKDLVTNNVLQKKPGLPTCHCRSQDASKALR
jgi:hypothetical protein